MQTTLDIIKDWPIIVQGALGSGLFWLVLLIGQKVTSDLTQKYAQHSKKSRLCWLVNRSAILRANLSGTDNEFSVYAMIMVYRASRYLFRALMWMALGLLSQVFIEPVSIIGFVGCLYYLFKGFNIVSGTDESREELDSELKTTLAEIEKISRNVQ